MIKGKEELNGEDYHIEEEETDQRPFKVFLDVGLQRTSVGARVWGALKGAADGGLHVPHENKNFPGYKAPEEKGADPEYDAEAHKERIFGGHVKEYMEKVEDMYTEAHEKIREDPDCEKDDKKEITYERVGNTMKASDGSEHNRSTKLTLKQRREKVRVKIATYLAKQMEE